MQNVLKCNKTGCSTFESQLATLCWEDTIVDRMGRKGTPSLWILVNPYKRGRIDPVGLINSEISEESKPLLTHFNSCLSNLDSIEAVRSWVLTGPNFKNFDVSPSILSILET